MNVIIIVLLVLVAIKSVVLIWCLIKRTQKRQSRSLSPSTPPPHSGDGSVEDPKSLQRENELAHPDEVMVDFENISDISYVKDDLRADESPVKVGLGLMVDTSFYVPNEPENEEWTGRYAPRWAQYMTHDMSFSHAVVPASPVDKHPLLPPIATRHKDKYTIVLDMDETLLHTKEHWPFGFERLDVVTLRFPDSAEVLYSIIRPYARELITRLGPLCELVLWTAGEEGYAGNVMTSVDTSNNISHFIYRDSRWFTMPNYIKSLKRLGRPMDKVLIVDNSEFVCIADSQNSIVIEDFFGNPHDKLLVALEGMLLELIRSGKSVPTFLAEHHQNSRLQSWGGFYRLTGAGMLARL
jgi:Dullard-like phosphatase family protein